MRNPVNVGSRANLALLGLVGEVDEGFGAVVPAPRHVLALQVHAAPGLVVSTSATASAGELLLPLILSLSSIGFIFSAVIALSPTAAEIFEEDELMRRIGRSQATRYDPAPAPAERRRDAEPGSLFRPQRPEDEP